MRNRYGYDPDDPNMASDGDFGPIPNGRYSFQVMEVSERETRSGGLALNLKARVTGPTHSGRVLFNMFNIRNANPKAQEIGLKQLHSFSTSTGIRRDWQELHEFTGLCFDSDIEQEDNGQYGIKNRFRRFHRQSVAGPAAMPRTPEPPSTPQPPDDNSTPF